MTHRRVFLLQLAEPGAKLVALAGGFVAFGGELLHLLLPLLRLRLPRLAFGQIGFAAATVYVILRR